MARHAEALRLWHNTWRAFRQVRGYTMTISSSSVVGCSSSWSDSLLSSCKIQTTLRAFSCGQNSRQLGLSSGIGLEVSRVLSDGFEERGRRMVPWNGVRHQHVSTATEDSKPAEEITEGITLTDNCIRRIQEIKLEEGPQGENKMLRLSVEGGGCSGFLYNFALDDKVNKDDRVFERNGAKLVVDDISFGFIKGATVDFTEELIRASFAVTINPNAASACGCGASFNAK